ncbi:MAG: deoxyribodipyrimidine photo-lyase [Kovacikia sp.]
MNSTIVWFRRDLRIADHAPLYRAALRGAVIPVFVFDRALLHHPETAVARVGFMLSCLQSLDRDLRDRGGRLILRFGDPVEVLPALIRETQAEGIYAHLDFERIYGRVRDARLNQKLAAQNLRIRWFEPSATTPALISYPDYRDLWYTDMGVDRVPVPAKVQVPPAVISDPLPTLEDLGLKFDSKPIPAGGTQAARQLLQEFLEEKSDRYYWQLSYPSAEATTGLSPYLKFGAISGRECFQTARRLERSPDERIRRSCQQLISRLRWGNGFAQRFRYLPQLELRSLYSIFDEDGWFFDEALYQAWQEGRTGFPIVDAAARCLQATGGWKELNFRSRALYSSFLSNLLGMDWRFGALHFMRHLIDGDCPIDHYQWAMQAGVTHCVDKTWTRIYNPEQSAVDRCDPEGTFIKRWLPELKNLPPQCLGSPALIKGYPAPIVDYKPARRLRVQQLERQRQLFLNQENIVSFLSRLPTDLRPFGSDRFPSEVSWATLPAPDLFPPPLDLNSLDREQSKALRTWFVASGETAPRKSSRRKPKVVSENIQLSLL